MATAGKNLSDHLREELPEELSRIPNGKNFNVGIVVAEWNYDITGNLLKGALKTLLENGVLEENIVVKHVPGTFELPLGAQYLLEQEDVHGVIAIGSVIQGETKHFDFVCQGAALGIKDVALEFSSPVMFCVLTDNTKQQAIDRSGGIHGNKGDEAAVGLLKMLDRF